MMMMFFYCILIQFVLIQFVVGDQRQSPTDASFVCSKHLKNNIACCSTEDDVHNTTLCASLESTFGLQILCTNSVVLDGKFCVVLPISFGILLPDENSSNNNNDYSLDHYNNLSINVTIFLTHRNHGAFTDPPDEMIKEYVGTHLPIRKKKKIERDISKMFQAINSNVIHPPLESWQVVSVDVDASNRRTVVDDQSGGGAGVPLNNDYENQRLLLVANYRKLGADAAATMYNDSCAACCNTDLTRFDARWRAMNPCPLLDAPLQFVAPASDGWVRQVLPRATRVVFIGDSISAQLAGHARCRHPLQHFKFQRPPLHQWTNCSHSNPTTDFLQQLMREQNQHSQKHPLLIIFDPCVGNALCVCGVV
jgi:hypothetical protein